MAVSAFLVSQGFLASPGMPKDTLARRMRVALAESDLKDFEVADRAHVTAAWLGSVKQGQLKNPPLDKLRAVAKVLGKTTSYFTVPLGYVPVEEIENGLLVSVAEDDRELFGRLASRLSTATQVSSAEDPPSSARSRRRA